MEASTTELRRNLAFYLEMAESGGRILITRDGHVIAQLGPPFIEDVDLGPATELRGALRLKLGRDVTMEELE